MRSLSIMKFIVALVFVSACTNSPHHGEITHSPPAYSHQKIVIAPNAKIQNVTVEETELILRMLKKQKRCQPVGPVTVIGKTIAEGKERLTVMTSRLMFVFLRERSGSWKLDSCGSYHY